MDSARKGGREKKLPPPTASEAAFERLLANFGNPSAAAGDAPPEAHAFLDELYAKAGAYLARDPYATIGEASGFNTKVAGVSFDGRQDIAGGLHAGVAAGAAARSRQSVRCERDRRLVRRVAARFSQARDRGTDSAERRRRRALRGGGHDVDRRRNAFVRDQHLRHPAARNGRTGTNARARTSRARTCCAR